MWFSCVSGKMKSLFGLFLLLILGCSSSAGPASSELSCPPPPGWIENVAPGTFAGTWILGNDTFPCTCKIADADTFFTGTVRNDSTQEILNLLPNGPFVIFWDAATPCGYRYFHAFNDRDSSNLYGDSDRTDLEGPWLSGDGDTLSYTTWRGDSVINIVAVRK